MPAGNKIHLASCASLAPDKKPCDCKINADFSASTEGKAPYRVLLEMIVGGDCTGRTDDDLTDAALAIVAKLTEQIK